MHERDDGGRVKTRRGRSLRDTLETLKRYLHSMEPDPEFSRRLEELCQSMGAEELFRDEVRLREDTAGHRGIIIGGAIFSALPFVGVAAYAIRKHVLRRRFVPMGA